MENSYDSQLDNLVDKRNISYDDARRILGEESMPVFEPTPVDTVEAASIDYKAPAYVPITPEEQARINDINARGKALGQAALKAAQAKKVQ